VVAYSEIIEYRVINLMRIAEIVLVTSTSYVSYWYNHPVKGD